jgi:hypothetical protein
MPNNLPSLTDHQLKILEQFSWMEISITELMRACASVMEFSFEASERRFSSSFRIPVPGIPITIQHIENALMRKRLGIVSEKDLVVWATMILLNDAYEINSSDEDVIAEWLNDLSFELDPFDNEKR